MRLFECGHCEQTLYFENDQCTTCGSAQGFDPGQRELLTLAPGDDGDWHHPGTTSQVFFYCINSEHQACNWLVPRPGELCTACRHNRTIPNLSDPRQQSLWRKIEQAKHRLFYSLLRFNLPLRTKQEAPHNGLAFDFVGNPNPEFRESKSVMTGHAEGLITLDIAEADPAERERQRLTMAEPYRTLLGHFRHEIGHYYWALLVSEGPWLEPCRALFGDDRRDYSDALAAHYQNGPPPDWPAHYVSAYATSHPWEDWAESWAHYFHIVDTLETAYHFGLKVDPKHVGAEGMRSHPKFDPYHEADFDRIIKAWFPITFAVNSLNRSMGQPDLYPFVLSDDALEKLDFVHRLIHNRKA
ncbi:MAG: putative zinc-binding peptidase [Pseudomonadota bacterium]|nr:putative zinc-binding peptidase [Pseudomonadota bacterium]